MINRVVSSLYLVQASQPNSGVLNQLAKEHFKDSGKKTKSERFFEVDSKNKVSAGEFAGRLCYNSFDLPNEGTAGTEEYIKNIIAQNHMSVLEHMSVSIFFKDVPRSLTHELVRHRHFSFSQESQRYVKQAPRIVVPAIISTDSAESDLLAEMCNKAYENYEDILESLELQGFPRKKAHEAARAVLPNCFATNIVVSGNLRSWFEFVQKRDSKHADADMQIVAHKVYKILAEVYPAIFNDENLFGVENTSEQKGPKNGG